MKPQSTQRKTLRTLKAYPLRDITVKIISCDIEVQSLLGPGMLENIYEEAMAHELKSR
jgi:hypothetical protein